MKVLERFLNWLKEAKERVTNWNATLIGFFIMAVTLAGALNLISPETTKKLEETINIAAPTLIDIFTSIGAISGSILGVMKIWEKDNKINTGIGIGL